MGQCPGKPFRAVLHSTDASAGVAVPLYLHGDTQNAYTLQDGEYLRVHVVTLVTAPGGDAYVLVGADATLSAGETAVRGTYAANGGVQNEEVYVSGDEGHTLFAVAPAGVVDVVIEGTIHQENSNGKRPSWRESEVPGN